MHNQIAHDTQRVGVIFRRRNGQGPALFRGGLGQSGQKLRQKGSVRIMFGQLDDKPQRTTAPGFDRLGVAERAISHRICGANNAHTRGFSNVRIPVEGTGHGAFRQTQRLRKITDRHPPIVAGASI